MKLAFALQMMAKRYRYVKKQVMARREAAIGPDGQRVKADVVHEMTEMNAIRTCVAAVMAFDEMGVRASEWDHIRAKAWLAEEEDEAARSSIG